MVAYAHIVGEVINITWLLTYIRLYVVIILPRVNVVANYTLICFRGILFRHGEARSLFSLDLIPLQSCR